MKKRATSVSDNSAINFLHEEGASWFSLRDYFWQNRHPFGDKRKSHESLRSQLDVADTLTGVFIVNCLLFVNRESKYCEVIG